jgi:CubicO group peptidase (beta-lactamase class C family)
MRIAIACLFAAATSACGPVPATPASSAEVAERADAYLRAHVDSGRFSGAVLLARDGKPLFARAYGFANEARRTPNSVATRFPIASVTKTFTATLVMQHERRGLLPLADSLCMHVAPCPAHWQAITIRHLLMHTAGVPDYARTADFAAKRGEPRTVDGLIAEFRELPLEFTPGAKYAYSNSNYILLGHILEKTGGKPFAELLRDGILTPLGMADTGMLSDVGAPDALARGYRPDGARNAEADFVHPSWLYAAGGMYSTVENLLEWDRALRSGSVLPPGQLALMWSTEHGAYGYGWQLMQESPQSLGRRLVFHAGGITGHASDFVRYPDEGVSVIILANLMPVPLAEISRDLSAIVFGERHAVPAVRRPAAIDPALYDSYAGRYQLAPDVEIAVWREGDRLLVQATGQPRDVAVPESAQTFYSRVSPVRLSFVTDASGRAVSLVLHAPDGDLSAPRK